MDRAALEQLRRGESIELVVRMTRTVAVVGRPEEPIAEQAGRLTERDTATAERATTPKTSES